MRNFTLSILTILLSGHSFAQTTYIPDDNFEQRLIDLGYDDVLDDEVLTENIEGVSELYLNSYDISDLTGIEDFSSLTSLSCSMNNLEELDVSANSALQFLYFNENSIHSIDLSSNTLLEVIGCAGNDLETIDLSLLAELRVFIGYWNMMTELDVSACPLLEIISCGSNEFIELDFSNNPLLNDVNCANNDLLQVLSVKNGNNGELDFFVATSCPLLTCIEVDDPTYSEENWLEKDPSANYDTNCGLSIEALESFEVRIYPSPANDNLNVQITQKSVNFSLIDIAGKSIETGVLEQGANSLNVETLPAGIYFLALNNGNQTMTSKVIIK